MANANNSLVKAAPPSFSVFAKSDKSQKTLMSYFPSDKDRARFTSAIITAVSQNPLIANCTNESIMSAGLKCVNYDFLPGGDLGDAYLIPFGNKCTVMLGYKGLIRLAQRSGKVRTLNMGTVRMGQNVVHDALSGDITITGEPNSPDAEAIGYFAFIRLSGSGFEKAEYMTKQEAIAHAVRYAKSSFDAETFARYEIYLKTGEGMTENEADKLGVYYTNFDQMAMKNVMRRLLLRWAPLSITDQQMLRHDENPAEPVEMPAFGEQQDDVIDLDDVPAPAAEKKNTKPKEKHEPIPEDDFFN